MAYFIIDILCTPVLLDGKENTACNFPVLSLCVKKTNKLVKSSMYKYINVCIYEKIIYIHINTWVYIYI